ncbi:MAG: site-specific integrase [Planctomycetota bacterium]|nr:site-specific integrase [Planctomycetota bacterium]
MPRTSNRGKKFPAEILSREEIGALMRSCSRRAPTGIRNRALIAVLYRAGLRLSEALSLRPKDLDRDAGTLRILRGKGRQARTVGMDPAGFAVLERWLDVRSGKLGINGACRTFCTLSGKEVQPSYIRALLPRLGRKAGIEKRVHAHGLRHAFSSELAREGVPVPLISRQLGHANIRTTTTYLSGISPEETVKAIRSRRWNGGAGPDETR